MTDTKYETLEEFAGDYEAVCVAYCEELKRVNREFAPLINRVCARASRLDPALASSARRLLEDWVETELGEGLE